MDDQQTRERQQHESLGQKIAVTICGSDPVATGGSNVDVVLTTGQVDAHTGKTENIEVTESSQIGSLNFFTSPGTVDTALLGENLVNRSSDNSVTFPQCIQHSEDNSADLSSDSDSDSSTSSSSSSSCSSYGPLASVHAELDYHEECTGLGNGKKPQPIKTQDEILMEDLPAVEDLTVTVPEDTEIKPVGVISSVVDALVIIETFKDTLPLKDDSVIFNKDRLAIGRVFEVFGPVTQPYYVLRFNSPEHIKQKELKLQETVYFAPELKDFTEYIFTEQLKRIRGSDASWKNDQEPPPEAVDFSDDEQEQMAKRKVKEQNIQRRQQKPENYSGSETNKQRRCPQRGQNPSWLPRREQCKDGGLTSCRVAPTNLHGNLHSNHHANPYFRPPMDHGFPFPCPYPPPFQAPVFPHYSSLPPPHMGMPWPPPQFQGTLFQPPPPPPPPLNQYLPQVRPHTQTKF